MTYLQIFTRPNILQPHVHSTSLSLFQFLLWGGKKESERTSTSTYAQMCIGPPLEVVRKSEIRKGN